MAHGDRFLRLLCLLLLGYAIMGKGFAYLGVAPLYVGEMAMLYGVVALLCSENWSRVLQTFWLWPLLALMGWGLFRTLPYLSEYGTDALHDAAMWAWGTYAIVIATLLAARPARLIFLREKFRVFAKWFLLLAPICYLVTIRAGLPDAPWAAVPYILVKGGDLVVHLAGIFAFVVLLGGLKTVFVVPLTIVNLLLCFTGRASMVTMGTCMALVAMVRPKTPILLVFTLLVGVTLLWVFNVQIATRESESTRMVSADQIVDNVESLFIDTGRVGLAETKQWRLNWWDEIIRYTIYGPYFWQGKGFGVNLADDDGFQVERDHSLRDPHNGHLTMLARGGVPMLGLWIICQLTLGYGLLSGAWSAHRRHDRRWFGMLLFLFIYWLAFLINATFDVFLEGPVGGIWFWCVYGTGIGAVWIYRNCPAEIYPRVIPRTDTTRPAAKKPSLLDLHARADLP